tara:strand:+ start:234 stop:476 length:243 start_codon:yes stop_codon:yes gene_type:complete
MKKDRNFEKKSDDIIKDGPPWTVIGHFSTYDEAVKRVDEEREPDSDYDYKIKRYEKDFRVKKRLRKDLLKNKKNNKKIES